MKKLFISALIASTASMAITSAATLTVGNRAGYGILNLDKLIIKSGTTDSAVLSGDKIGVAKICSSTALTDSTCKNVSDLLTSHYTKSLTIKGSGTTVTTFSQSADATVDIVAGNNVTISPNSPSAGKIKISAKDSTYDAGVGLVLASGIFKAKLRSESNATYNSNTLTNTKDRQYAVVPDKSGYLSVNVPWEKGEGVRYTADNGVVISKDNVIQADLVDYTLIQADTKPLKVTKIDEDDLYPVVLDNSKHLAVYVPGSNGGDSLWKAGRFSSESPLYQLVKRMKQGYVTPTDEQANLLLPADIYSPAGFSIFVKRQYLYDDEGGRAATYDYSLRNKVDFTSKGVGIGTGYPAFITGGLGLSVAGQIAVGYNYTSKMSSDKNILNNVIYIYASGAATDTGRHYEIMGNNELAVGTRYGSFVYFKPATDTYLSGVINNRASVLVSGFDMNTTKAGTSHIIHGIQLPKYQYIYDTYDSMNVGINTDNPIATLDVNGSIKVSSNCIPQSLSCDINHVGTMLYFATGDVGVLAFCTQKGASSFQRINLLNPTAAGKTQLKGLGYSESNNCIIPTPTPSNPRVIPVPRDEPFIAEEFLGEDQL